MFSMQIFVSLVSESQELISDITRGYLEVVLYGIGLCRKLVLYGIKGCLELVLYGIGWCLELVLYGIVYCLGLVLYGTRHQAVQYILAP